MPPPYTVGLPSPCMEERGLPGASLATVPNRGGDERGGPHRQERSHGEVCGCAGDGGVLGRDGHHRLERSQVESTAAPATGTGVADTMGKSEARGGSEATQAPATRDVEPASSGGPESGERASPHSFTESFECCVCLDLLYKPIVLVCGHISCFWCVHKAMDGFKESHCPMCRQPYVYFPAICQVFHNLLRKIEPVAYRRREKETLEIESKQNCFSPQFVDQFPEKNHIGNPLEEQSTSTVIDAPLDNGNNDNGFSEAKHVSVDNLPDHSLKKEASQNLCISDVLCTGCKQLLFQPAVLNCGHVYCEPCLLSLGDETPRCQVCQSVHPGHLPKVCLQLSGFLEKKFPDEYACRRKSFEDLLHGGCQAIKRESRLDNRKKALSMEDLLRIHIQIGCDSCGMYPIVGKRYKCKDCKEEIGFDLCGACYDTRSKLPARFNQQHTPDHTFVLDETNMFGRWYGKLLTHDFEDYSGDTAENEALDDGAHNPS